MINYALLSSLILKKPGPVTSSLSCCRMGAKVLYNRIFQYNISQRTLKDAIRKHCVILWTLIFLHNSTFSYYVAKNQSESFFSFFRLWESKILIMSFVYNTGRLSKQCCLKFRWLISTIPFIKRKRLVKSQFSLLFDRPLWSNDENNPCLYIPSHYCYKNETLVHVLGSMAHLVWKIALFICWLLL